MAEKKETPKTLEQKLSYEEQEKLLFGYIQENLALKERNENLLKILEKDLESYNKEVNFFRWLLMIYICMFGLEVIIGLYLR